MKKLVYVVTVALMAIAILSVGCSKPAPAPSAPEIKTGTGSLTGINTAAEPGPDAITVKTPEGVKTIPLAANATINLEGQTCTLDQLEGLELANVSYNCTYVYAWDPETTHEEIVAVNVRKIVPAK